MCDKDNCKHLKAKICKNCGFEGIAKIYFGKKGRSNLCRLCYLEHERVASYVRQGKPVSKRSIFKDYKICKNCGFKGEKSLFYKGLCKPCKSNKNKEIWRKNHGPKKIYPDIKTCPDCSFIGNKSLFSGKTCKPCYNKKRRNITNETRKNLLNRDPAWRLRNRISNSVRKMLKRTGGSKNNSSISEYLHYTPEDLKNHLESLFEPWMTWENYGPFKIKNWNDNDPTTWTWNIDHIIPQSKLPYTSMEDENFQKTWALENLRPYSAKQNIADGNKR